MTQEAITALVRGKLVSVPLEQVTHFKTDCKYVEAYYPGGVLLLDGRLRLHEVERRFRGRFIRVHRCTLVDPRRILQLQRDKETKVYRLTLEGVAAPLNVGRTHIAAVRHAMAEHTNSEQ